MTRNSERELIEKARKQDTAAIKSLYDKYVQYLAAVCRTYVPSEDDAKDILQDSFLKIFSSLDRFEWRGEGSLKLWMRRIVVNEALMFLRRQSKFRTESLPEGDRFPEETGGDPEISSLPMPELLRLIRELPDGYRTVFNLYVFEQKSHKEIAGLLGISENTSYSQFSRARALLAKKIKEYGKDGQ